MGPRCFLRRVGTGFLPLALVSGCLTDPPRDGVVETPDFVRFTSPADGAVNVGTAPYSISITFRRPIDARTVRLRIVPEWTAVPEEPLTMNRTLTWVDTPLPSTPHAIAVLVDGPDMPHPYLFRFSPGTESRDYGRIGGAIKVPARWSTTHDIMVLAVRAIPGELGAGISTLVRRPAESIARAAPHPADDGQIYLLPHLEDGRDYYVLAVLDSSGDGRLHPPEDAYGVFASGPGLVGVATARGWIEMGDHIVPGWRTDVDLELIDP